MPVARGRGGKFELNGQADGVTGHGHYTGIAGLNDGAADR